MYSYDSLKSFTHSVLSKCGCPPHDADLASEVLLSADMRGVDSHGVARLIDYVRQLQDGTINPVPEIKVTHETPSTAVVDGGNGIGLIVAPKAMEIAMAKAESVGSGWVSVGHSHHFGIAAYHAMLGLKKDMVGIAMTNATPLVAPTFSNERMLGTNPISVAIPAGSEPPFVADFATSTVANGKLEILQRKEMPAPLGWLQQSDGQPTTDAHGLKNDGALLPLGGDREHGSHKGYCLGSIVDIFSAVFSGANYGPWVPGFVSYTPTPDESVGAGLGHFLGAMRIDAFRPADEFKTHMDNWITRFRNASQVHPDKPVYVPGDPERISQSERKIKGIPLHQKVVNDLNEVARKLGLTFLS